MVGVASASLDEMATPLPGRAAAVLARAFPRLLANSLGPVGAFYVGDRLWGVVAGMVLASLASLGLFAWERRRGRPGMLARLSLAVVLLQATLGLGSRSAYAYFLPAVGLDLVEGVAFSLSALSRRPLAWFMAREILSLPPHLVLEPPVRKVFRRITLLWGGYFLGRGLVCFVVLSVAGTHSYLLTRVVLDLPGVLLLLSGSLVYGLGRLERAAAADVPSAPPARTKPPRGAVTDGCVEDQQ